MNGDLAQFIRERLAEDEELTCHLPDDGNYERCLTTGALGINNVRAQSALASPQRALAEVDAKRRIVDRYEAQRTVYAAHMGDILTKYLVRELEAILRLLALPFADHPDYQPEWAPEASAD